MALKLPFALPLAAALTMAFAPVAMAQHHRTLQPHKQQEFNQRATPQQKSKRRPTLHQSQPKKKVVKSLPGRAPSADQLRRLPRLPKGREYRVVNNRLVHVNSNTAEIIAILGLFSIFLQNR